MSDLWFLSIMDKLRRKPTPRQIAFFKFMGVDDVEERMTKEEVGEILTSGFSDWWFRRYGDGPEQMQWFYERSSEWDFQRIILHPDLYPSERRDFLEHAMIDEVGTYVRGQFTGSSEKTTRAKLLQVADLMLTENPNWWRVPDRKKAFLAKFQLIFPNCCNGRRPERVSSPIQAIPKGTLIQVVASRSSQIQPPKKPFASTGEQIAPLTATKMMRTIRKDRRHIVFACLATLLFLVLLFLVWLR